MITEHKQQADLARKLNSRDAKHIALSCATCIHAQLSQRLDFIGSIYCKHGGWFLDASVQATKHICDAWTPWEESLDELKDWKL